MSYGPERDTGEIMVQGLGVSPGVACGSAFLLKSDEEAIAARVLQPDMVCDELERFTAAIDATRKQIETIQRDLREHVTSHDARILDVHLMILDDDEFLEEIRKEIRERMHNAEYAAWMVSERYVETLSRVDDDYLRERKMDVRDIVRRLVRFLGGRKSSSLELIPPGSIVVAESLAPSDTALLRRELACGLACDFGSPVSHSAIMARALEIPAVVALHDLTQRVMPGETLLIDGNKGMVIIRPSAATIKAYDALVDRRQRLRVDMEERVRGLPPVSGDQQVTLSLRANIDAPDDVDDVLKYGGDGIGLFRSENYFFRDGCYASEQTQADVYRTLVNRMHRRPVIVRTLDMGGDKQSSDHYGIREDNPFLGCRGIRLCLSRPDAFRTQLRAIAAVAAEGNLKFMYPMVSDVGEIIRANDFLRETCESLGVSMPEVGVMIETPAAAVCADALAPHVAFMSIGSNDLIQYAMAADRGNDLVSHLFRPAHPAVLRLIHLTVEAAGDKVPVGICGEMAADPMLTPLLIGLGVSDLSMVASSIPLIKTVVRAVTMDEARSLTEDALKSRSVEDVQQRCCEWLRQRVPDVYELVS